MVELQYLNQAKIFLIYAWVMSKSKWPAVGSCYEMESEILGCWGL
jgi:hypothetical protein